MSLDSIAQPHFGAMRPNTYDSFKPASLPSLSSNMGQAKRKRSDDDKVASDKSNKTVKKCDHEEDEGEKKRNKLGYHRTSVACGHCRRRKIRCMMPDDDPTGRCSNCIRLKKECNFYPVDQATKGSHPSARAVSMPKGALRSQSPTPMYLPSSYSSEYPAFGAGHSSFSVPPPDTTGLGLFTTTAAGFDGSYSTAYDAPVTSWESSPYASLPPLSAPQFESPISASPAPQSFTRPSSTFRPSPFADSAYGSTGSSKADVNELGWHRSMSPNMDGRRSASIPAPPSLIMGSDISTTPTLSEPTTIAPMSTTVGSSYWSNPWTPIPGTEGMVEPSKAFNEPFDNGSWFPDPINSY